MPKENIRWGILGCAAIAFRALVPAIRESGTGELRAIASRDLAKAKRAADEQGIPIAYGSYQELLDDPEIDAVYIPLPNHLHLEWTIQAAQAGKHVLSEKPASLNEPDTVRMIEACAQHGVAFAEGFMYRYHPRYARMRDIIAAGEIGEVRAIVGSFTFNNAGDAGNIRYRSEWGGGSVYDVGVYPINAARYILGEEPRAATVAAQFSADHGGVDMMASGLLEFPGGVTLHFDCGMWTVYRNGLEIVGSEGRIVVPHAFLHPPEGADFNVYRGEEERVERVPIANDYALMVDAFGRHILHGEPLPFAPEDAVKNMRAVDACLRSAREQARIAIA